MARAMTGDCSTRTLPQPLPLLPCHWHLCGIRMGEGKKTRMLGHGLPCRLRCPPFKVVGKGQPERLAAPSPYLLRRDARSSSPTAPLTSAPLLKNGVPEV